MEGKEVDRRAFYGRLGDEFWELWDLQREVKFSGGIVSDRHRGCWRFSTWGPGYPYDILELGSYLVGREELGFGQCFTVHQWSRRHLDNGGLLASGSGI